LRAIAIILSATTLAFATAASAQPAAATASDDAKCLLDMVALANAGSAETQQVGRDGVAFFTGRISAREPGFDFMRLKTMAQTLNPQTAQTELQQRCGPMLQKYMGQLVAALGGTATQSPAAPNPH
jgi:hypothetical protein